jgi:hypothetical protein
MATFIDQYRIAKHLGTRPVRSTISGIIVIISKSVSQAIDEAFEQSRNRRALPSRPKHVQHT